MKHKILYSISAGLIALVAMPLFLSPPAFAKDGGDNNSRGRGGGEDGGRNPLIQVSSVNQNSGEGGSDNNNSGNVTSSVSDNNNSGGNQNQGGEDSHSNSLNINSGHGGSDDGDGNDDDSGEHNVSSTIPNPGDIQALIARLEAIIAQLQAQIDQLLGHSHAPIISNIVVSNVSSTSATIGWTTDESATSKVYYSLSSPVNLLSALTVSDNTSTTSHSLNLSGLTPSSTYFFIVESVDSANNVSRSGQLSFTTFSPGAINEPVISSVSASSLTPTSSTVNWLTDESATSKVYYSTSSPINFLTALTVTNNASTTSHSIILSGLNPSTTYFFAVESMDASSSVTRSGTFFFATPALPVISLASAANVSSTTAQINWQTNVLSDSRAFYSLTTPVNLGTASTTFNGSSVTGHTINLFGLTPSSTYFFVTQSKDIFGDVATSTEGNFVTTP